MSFSSWLQFVLRRPVHVLVVALGFAALGAWLASQLSLRTAFSELLPQDDPGVVTLAKTQARMGDLSLLLVGIRSPDLGASERYAEALTNHLRQLPSGVCEMAAYHMREVHAFLEENRWLYAAETGLLELRDRLRREITRRKNPLFVDLSEDDEEEDAALEQKLQRTSGFEGKFAGGLFKHASSETLWAVALPSGGIMGENGGEALVKATQAFVREHPPSQFHPLMDVEVTGPAVTPARNRLALERDLIWVTSLCGVLIPLSIFLYFRRVRSVVYVIAPAMLATLLAYAFAYLVFGYLTTVTSFLVSFIMGNGTNYAIVLLSHYEERRRAGLEISEAVLAASSDLFHVTGLAAIASALSYLSLMVTSFRGFTQFGLMGAAGCLLAWLCTFTVLPALISLMGGKARARTVRFGKERLLSKLGAALFRRRFPVLVVCAVLSLGLGAGALRFRKDAFEYNFRKLSAPALTDARTEAFDKEKDALFGRWPQPNVVLADKPDDVRPLRQAIRDADRAEPGRDVIGQMLSLDDLLPGDREEQERKLELIAQIRTLTNDPALAVLSTKEKEQIDRVRPPDSLRLVSAQDLPALARRPFTEADGTYGRVLLVYPPEHGMSVWNGRDLLRTAAVIQHVKLPDGRTVETSGGAVIFASMIRSILRDGPIATAASLLAVILLVLLRVRPLRAAAVVIGGLMIGVCWMLGIAGWLGVKITFLNFIALPFIFGVGVEYAIHVVGEYRHTQSVPGTVVSAGGPVALCSWSAIVGYGSLLVARNGALRGLGGLATVGEIACMLAAVVVVPLVMSLWTWQQRQPVGPAAADASKQAG